MEDHLLQQALVEHIQAIEQLTGFKKGQIPDEEAVRELQSFWNQTCRLRRHAQDNPLPADYRRMVDALFVLSREMVILKKEEFACYSLYSDIDDEGEGGTAIGSPLKPVPTTGNPGNASILPSPLSTDDETDSARS
jgi:hypothetical protein